MHSDKQDAPDCAQEVDVWCARVAACAEAGVLPDYAALLSARERERNQRFVFDRDRHTDLVARALVRTVLGRLLGVAAQDLHFEAGPRGKPKVAGLVEGPGALSFNLTHCHDMVMLAVTRGCEVGLDVEGMARQAPLDVAARYFMPSETQALFALPSGQRVARFWALWTLKEALVKASGDGLYAPLDGFGFDLDEQVPGTVRLRVAPQADDVGLRRPWWFGQWLVAPEHMAALCVASREGVVPVIKAHQTVPLVNENPLHIEWLRASQLRPDCVARSPLLAF